MLRVTFASLLLLALAYIGYALWFLFLQRRTVFPRHRIPYEKVLIGPPEDAEIFWIDLDTGGKAECWLLQPMGQKTMSPAPLAIAAHGNGEVIDRWAWKVQGLREQGFAVLLVEYPGYGRSTGLPSEESVTEAMVKAYDAVISRPEINRERILFVGRSIGTGAVCRLSRFRSSHAMILISPFTSIWDHARIRILPPALVKDPFDNLGAVREYREDLLIVHGKKDKLNPFVHAEKLRDAHTGSDLFVYPESAHHDCPPDWIQLWLDVKPFLTKTGFFSD